jgi:hypothetical protein
MIIMQYFYVLEMELIDNNLKKQSIYPYLSRIQFLVASLIFMLSSTSVLRIDIQ